MSYGCGQAGSMQVGGRRVAGGCLYQPTGTTAASCPSPPSINIVFEKWKSTVIWHWRFQYYNGEEMSNHYRVEEKNHWNTQTNYTTITQVPLTCCLFSISPYWLNMSRARWPTLRRFRFRYDFYEKAVTFKPYQVDMLDPVTANFLGDNLRCWMQIQVQLWKAKMVQPSPCWCFSIWFVCFVCLLHFFNGNKTYILEKDVLLEKMTFYLLPGSGSYKNCFRKTYKMLAPITVCIREWQQYIVSFCEFCKIWICK